MFIDYQRKPKSRISELSIGAMRVFELKAGVPMREIERRYLEQEGIVII